MTRVNMKRFAREMMGKQVRFTKVLHRVSVPPEGHEDFGVKALKVAWTRTWKARDLRKGERSVGWVVGLRRLLTGKTAPGSGGGGAFDDYDPPTFHETGPRILAYMVVPLPTMKPIPVPPDAIEVLSEFVEPEFLDRKTREFWSKDAVNWPRDESGKFAKTPPVNR